MRRVVLTVVSTVAGLVMLLTFKAHTSTSSAASTALPPAVAAPSAATSSSSTGSSSTSSTGTGSTGSATSTAAPSPSRSSAASTTRVLTGSVATNQYESIQVQIEVTAGRLTKVAITRLDSNDGRSQEINSYAIPQLQQATIAAGSARIDTVSGATYTSDSYRESLQSALDKAGL